MSVCYCDYGEPATIYERSVVAASRKEHRCDECFHTIPAGLSYERARMLFEGRWNVLKTCARCLDLREYVTAHAPCFCWMHGSMLGDAKDVIDQYGHESAGFYIGATKRLLRAQRQGAAA